MAKDQSTKRIVPGPGAYNNNGSPNKQKAPAFGFGSDSKCKNLKSDTPGPG
jgi:hypothetical protein